mmetsp:Transcript_17247/g.29725  ORF Transcript_17247/g.29725 Transcript_17247/m.29725 type:complete len:83 (+) Transcript_17247:116-364(+)
MLPVALTSILKNAVSRSSSEKAPAVEEKSDVAGMGLEWTVLAGARWNADDGHGARNSTRATHSANFILKVREESNRTEEIQT